MTRKEANMGAESQDQEFKGTAEDLELNDDEAGQIKGGVTPIEGGDSGTSGFSLSSIKWKMRRRSKKKKSSSSSGSTAGGRPV
jgi:hypothetical protein